VHRRLLGASTAPVVVILTIIAAIVVFWVTRGEQSTQVADQPSQPLETADSPSPSAGLVDDERIKRATVDEPGGWIAYGQSYDEQRFSSLTQINRETVSDLGLAWFKPVDERHRMQATPLVVDGVMYYTDPWSVVYAVDAANGEEIWTFDPKTRREFIRYSCCGGPINRGVAVYKGRVYVATFDARLLAIDAASGEKVWDVDTTAPDALSPFTVTAAPRVAAGNVYIGQSSSEFGIRGYVTAYDAETGEQVWRFFLVPGDPSKPFEHPEMELAAETWNGEWWKYGGGGTVWNSIVYDAEFHTLYLGVGNGAPWSREIRSPGGGDNLFLTAIVAVDPDSGRMKWYYQTVPGDNWDYSSAMDMALADLEVDGVQRKVLMQAPKNGFFYVIDRVDGKLLRAHPFAVVTWATHVDLATGRPVENPDAAFEEKPQWIVPGNAGAHNWQSMSYDASRGIMYIPTHDLPFFYALPESFAKTGIYKVRWGRMNLGVALGEYRNALIAKADPKPEPQAHLKAFNPLTGEVVWSVRNKSGYNGGVLATAGGVIFQGDGAGIITAHDTDNGETLWQYEAYASIGAPPITYEIDGTQYVAIMVGNDRRYDGGGKLMVFSLGGATELPVPQKRDYRIPEQPPLTASAEDLKRGDQLYHEICANCHGGLGRSYMAADLRRMSRDRHSAFEAIVLDGKFKDRGMESFAEFLTSEDTERIRQYIIFRANTDREAQQARANE